MAKLKICEGKGMARGYENACKKEVFKVTTNIGLCDACLIDWMKEDENGKIYKLTVFQPKVDKKTKQRNHQFKKELREKLKTRSDYEKELQKQINTIVRLIDKGCCCISSMKPLNAKFDAGHFYSVGSNPALRFNLFNIYAQSVYSNQYLSGDLTNFLSGLSRFYGEEHKEYVLNLKKLYPWLKLGTDEIKRATITAKQIVKELKAADQVYTPQERLELRAIYNNRLKIYNPHT